MPLVSVVMLMPLVSVMMLMESCGATLRTRVASHGAIQQQLNSHKHNTTNVFFNSNNYIWYNATTISFEKKLHKYNQITTNSKNNVI